MPLWSQHDHAVSTLRPALTEAGLFYISRTLNPAQLLVSKIDGVAAETHPPFGGRLIRSSMIATTLAVRDSPGECNARHWSSRSRNSSATRSVKLTYTSRLRAVFLVTGSAPLQIWAGPGPEDFAAGPGPYGLGMAVK